MLQSRAFLLIALACLGCGGPAPAESPKDGVVLSERPAPSGYLELAQLSVQSGKGCGLFGKRGSMEEAETMLRTEAERRGASYVRITDVKKPRPNRVCLEHEYKLSGVAYRAPNMAPAQRHGP